MSSDTLRVHLPTPVEATLTNGLTVLILEDHRLPHVLGQMHLYGASALFEPDDEPGLTAATAQMLRKGTQTRTGRQLDEELGRLGATVEATARFGAPDAVMTASGLSDNVDAWLVIALDVLLHPSFPAAALTQFKERTKVQWRQQRATPRFLARERFHHAAYGAHPTAVVAPTLEAIETLTPARLKQWHRERYGPQGAVLAIAGDVHAAQFVARLEAWCADWSGPPSPPAMLIPPRPTSTRTVSLVDRPHSMQTTLTLGNIAIDCRSNDFVPMAVMNHLLGGGPAAKLFLNLRATHGYTYGVSSNYTAVEYPGPWQISTDVRTEVTAGALTELFNAIRRIREVMVSEAELAEGKRAMIATFALALEQPACLLELALTRKRYALPRDYWDAYLARVAAVTADDIQHAARTYLQSDALHLGAVGDGRTITPILEKYGAVGVYDREGKRIPSAATPGTP